MTELPERKFRIVLDVEVKVDKTWHNRSSRHVDDVRLWRQGHLRGRANLKKPIPFDDY